MSTTTLNKNLKLTPIFFLIPMFILIALALYLHSKNALSKESYIHIQKDTFIRLNFHLSQFPRLAYNLTQFGDTLIVISFLTCLLLYVPKIKEPLILASIISAIFSISLKKLFAVPRPPSALDRHDFVIIGKALTGHSSLPSGHTITVFTTLTVLWFVFFPKKITYKIGWSLGLLSIGIIVALTRVAIGAHYPIDVISGGLIGYISGLLGILLGSKVTFLNRLHPQKYHPILLVLCIICSILVLNKIVQEHLIIYNLTLISLAFTLYKLIFTYYVYKRY